ncbi:hypothetical protein BDR26DRAFT_1008446 [Obelidium mucronatum]|nr:hypothetical protein BDR26DRAFT_1008446 [Obelidium mucronatum]
MSASKNTKKPITSKSASPIKKPVFDDVIPLFQSPRKKQLMGTWFRQTRTSKRTKFTRLAAMIKQKLGLTIDSMKLKSRSNELDELADALPASEGDDDVVETDALLADIQESAAATSGNHNTRYLKQIATFLSRIATSQESLVKQNAAQIFRQSVAVVSNAGVSFDAMESMKLSKTDSLKAANKKKLAKEKEKKKKAVKKMSKKKVVGEGGKGEAEDDEDENEDEDEDEEEEEEEDEEDETL